MQRDDAIVKGDPRVAAVVGDGVVAASIAIKADGCPDEIRARNVSGSARRAANGARGWDSRSRALPRSRHEGRVVVGAWCRLGPQRIGAPDVRQRHPVVDLIPARGRSGFTHFVRRAVPTRQQQATRPEAGREARWLEARRTHAS